MSPNRRRKEGGRKVRTINQSVDGAPLARVLGQSEQVQDMVEDAAEHLGEVNTRLKEHVDRDLPLREVSDALDESVDVEVKVQKAADELVVVNDALAAEIDERMAIERELNEKQSELDEKTTELSEKKIELTASRIKEKRSRHDSLHDAVTGLPNAILFNDRLENALAQANRERERLAVMFIDLDDFKAVNDERGHDAGDAVLQKVGERLGRFVRGGDTVGRRGGDEFLFLMLDAKDADNARALALRIAGEISAPMQIGGNAISVHASIGVAMFPEDGENAGHLLKVADKSMYEAKRQGTADSPPRGRRQTAKE